MAPETPLDSRFLMDGAREILSNSGDAKLLREQVEALEEAVLRRPGIALDLAKSLIETTCRTILEDLGAKIEGKPDCPKLVRETLGRMRVAPVDAPREIRDGVKNVLSGISTVVNGLCTLRNREGSASHGRDAFARLLEPSRALLAARAADAMVGFLWAVHKGRQDEVLLERLLYEENVEFNDWIDSQFDSPIEILGISLTQSETLFKTDRLAYRDLLMEFISSWQKREAQINTD